MNFKEKPIGERRKLLRSYPVLISSFPGRGKTASIETLSDEDKQRTIIFDLEGKGLVEDYDDQYFRVVRFKPLNVDPSKEHMYADYDNVKYKTLPELKIYVEAVMNSNDVDRVIIDSFTALVDMIEKHYATVNNGFNVWKAYNDELHDWFTMLKDNTRFTGTICYVMGHYVPSKSKADIDSEKFTKVSGTKHYRLVESHFSTVLTIEDFKFKADNSNEYDSTRIARSLSPFETESNSIAELESIFFETK